MFLIILVFSLFMPATAMGLCESGRSCSDGKQCMITLTANVSATVTFCDRLENPKYILSCLDENEFTVSRSEYFDLATSTWMTSSTLSYTLEEINEVISSLYCSLEEERYTKVKREVKLKVEESDDRTEDDCVLSIFVTFGFSVIIACGASLSLYRKGYVQIPVETTYRCHPEFRYFKSSNSHFYRLSIFEMSSECVNYQQLIQKIESHPERRIVFFTGNSGSGKTCLLKNILKHWESGKVLKKYTLLYLELNCMSPEHSYNGLIGKVYFFLRHVKATMNCQKLIVVLDGVQIPLPEGLIRTLLNKFEGIALWIGCRDFDETNFNLMRKESLKVSLEECSGTLLENMFNELVSLTNVKGSFTSPDDVLGKYVSTQRSFETVLSFPVTAWLLTLIYLDQSDSPKEKMDKEIKAVSTFPSGTPLVKKEAVHCLIALGNWDVLACLMEAFTKDDDEHTTYVNMLHRKDMEFKHVDDHYTRQAVLHLCCKMKKEERKPTTIQFYSSDPTWLEGYLPKVATKLIFRYTCLKDDDCFSFLLKTVLESCQTIEFHLGELPEKVSVQNIPDIEKVTVTHTRNDGSYFLDPKTGNWEKTVYTNEE